MDKLSLAELRALHALVVEALGDTTSRPLADVDRAVLIVLQSKLSQMIRARDARAAVQPLYEAPGR